MVLRRRLCAPPPLLLGLLGLRWLLGLWRNRLSPPLLRWRDWLTIPSLLLRQLLRLPPTIRLWRNRLTPPLLLLERLL